MFRSNEEVFDFGRELRSELLLVGRDDLADRLGEVVESSWTSATEALGELLQDLEVVRGTASDQLSPSMRNRLPIAIREIREAIDRANSGGAPER